MNKSIKCFIFSFEGVTQPQFTENQLFTFQIILQILSQKTGQKPAA